MRSGVGKSMPGEARHVKPSARKDLVTLPLEGETLVYDPRHHRVHSLNRLAAFLLEAADGRQTLQDLARRASRRFGQEISLELVEFGLFELHRARLLEGGPPGVRRTLDRRRLVGRLSAVGLLWPVVTTLLSPIPLQAATLVTPAQCASNPGAVGLCCTTRRRCRQVGSVRRCNGTPC